jgi:hypothetical protein
MTRIAASVTFSNHSIQAHVVRRKWSCCLRITIQFLKWLCPEETRIIINYEWNLWTGGNLCFFFLSVSQSIVEWIKDRIQWMKWQVHTGKQILRTLWEKKGEVYRMSWHQDEKFNEPQQQRQPGVFITNKVLLNTSTYLIVIYRCQAVAVNKIQINWTSGFFFVYRII